MADELMSVFEAVWRTLHARWCDQHDLRGASAFSHERVKTTFFHRVAGIDVDDADVDRLIDDALAYFREQNYDCVFTLSPLDRPSDFAEHLQRRGFTPGSPASTMLFDSAAIPDAHSVAQVDVSDESDYEIWADVMCQSFGHPPEMGEVGRTALNTPEARRYLARVDGVPVGTTMLYSTLGMGYVDVVGTLPEFRRQGIASALVTRALVDSQELGNRWTTLGATTGSEAERLYEGLGFRTVYHRHRYGKSSFVEA